ncbi:hypothetical protein HELRODRAFT_107263 [Helobdella robusta]|uniref:C2 domain-containing protein n=1 Tax=Helobdella robusta TaxID=6412 RepID=T1EE92_HELRO|nr:hypothetical protein HELRODRAFT_107263 [Helobdella robusta]ESN96011.1 hypothetical protein HELRODRAFT_107263 [Helobdella robusta]
MMMAMMEKRNDSNDHSGLWRDSELEERERSCPDGDDNDDVVGRGGGDHPNSRFIVDPDATSELEYGSLGPLKRDKKQKSLTNLVDSLSNSLESLMSVYSGAGEVHYGKIIVRGEVQISCLYNETSTKLDVTVHQCKDLAVVNFKKKTSNPYIKCYLLPDKSRLSKRKSNIKKGTLNPIFDTIFHVPAGTIEQRSLELSVWHADKQGRNDFLGECVVQLNSQQLVNIGQPVWFKLKNRVCLPSSPLTYYGDVDVSLKFLSRESLESHVIRSSGRGELQVLVKQARNLSTDKSSNLNGSFCKATLMHRDKKKILKEKSDLVRPIRNTCVWNQTFLFKDVSRMELMQACLELTFWDKDKNSNDFLGGVRLNTGPGKAVGREPPLNWMDGRGEEMLMWQSMIDRPDSWIDGTLMLRSTMTSRK